jgi:hypothetical protein
LPAAASTASKDLKTPKELVKSLVPSGLKPNPYDPAESLIVLMTAFVDRSMITISPTVLDTKALPPSGSMAMANGLFNPEIVSTTTLVAVSTTVIVPDVIDVT